jgi:hypothetical protein
MHAKSLTNNLCADQRKRKGRMGLIFYRLSENWKHLYEETESRAWVFILEIRSGEKTFQRLFWDFLPFTLNQF